MDVVASKMVAACDLWLIAAGPGPGDVKIKPPKYKGNTYL